MKEMYIQIVMRNLIRGHEDFDTIWIHIKRVYV